MTEDKYNIESVSKAHVDIENRPKQARYSSPVLRAYGTVSKLTEGGSSTKVDGVNMTMK